MTYTDGFLTMMGLLTALIPAGVALIVIPLCIGFVQRELNERGRNHA